MTTALDRTWTALMEGLEDNNEGGITEEDVRAIAAHSRPSVALQAWGDPGPIPSSDWGRLHKPYDGVQALRMNSRVSAASKNYRHSTGSLSMNTTGFTYAASDAATQPRAFTYNWAVTVENPYDAAWGISWWVLSSEGSFPVAVEDEWDDEEVWLHHIEFFRADFAAATSGENVWTALSTGTKTVVLKPGDTLVPVLEYYGTYDSTGGSPDATITRCAMQVVSNGPVEGDWESPAVGSLSHFKAVNGDPSVRDTVMAHTTLTSPSAASTIVSSENAATRAHRNTAWGLVFQRASTAENNALLVGTGPLTTSNGWVDVPGLTVEIDTVDPDQIGDRYYRIECLIDGVLAGTSGTDVYELAIRRSSDDLIRGRNLFVVPGPVPPGTLHPASVTSVPLTSQNIKNLKVSVRCLQGSVEVPPHGSSGALGVTFEVHDIGPLNWTKSATVGKPPTGKFT